MSISETDKRGRGGGFYRVASVIILFLVWFVTALVVADPLLLPSPFAVLDGAVKELAKGELLKHTGITLARVLAAFVIAMSLGTFIGLVLGRNKRANALFDMWVVIFLNLPALVVIVLCYIWIGLGEAAAIAAVAINKIPLVVVMVREGARALSPSYDALAHVYDFGFWKRFRYMLLPQLAPHLASAARSGIALIWKIVLVVELLGRPDGVGFKIHLYFQLFDVRMVLVYALTFVIVMMLIELLVLQPVERAASAWRRA